MWCFLSHPCFTYVVYRACNFWCALPFCCCWRAQAIALVFARRLADVFVFLFSLPFAAACSKLCFFPRLRLLDRAHVADVCVWKPISTSSFFFFFFFGPFLAAVLETAGSNYVCSLVLGLTSNVGAAGLTKSAGASAMTSSRHCSRSPQCRLANRLLLGQGCARLAGLGRRAAPHEAKAKPKALFRRIG